MSHCKKYLFILTYLTLFISMPLHSMVQIDTAPSAKQDILKESKMYIDEGNLSLPQILKANLFKPYHEHSLHLGVNQKHVWIQFTLSNPTARSLEKIILINSPLLEHIALYRDNNLSRPTYRGVGHITRLHNTLSPHFEISIPPLQTQTYYMLLYSQYTPINFDICLYSKDTYIQDDKKQQLVNILLIGIVLALMIYSLMLFVYVKDRTYLYYGFYLFALLYQQSTYLGLTQIYAPLDFILFDMQIVAFKINFLIIASALFAMSFLKLDKRSTLYRIYRWIIYVAILEMVIMSFPDFYNLTLIILTGAFFITFNLFAGVTVYLRGYKQARLFVLGFSIVFISYMIIIFDALGFSDLLLDFRNILMYTTTFEALILSLAFADRYLILQQTKENLDKQILKESQEKEAMITQMVNRKTEELNETLKEKELLLREIQHRVKNNLQIILSMIRMQNDASSDQNTKETLERLENRINAISKTYSMLLTNNDIQDIDMKVYVEELLNDLIISIGDKERKQIKIISNIHANLPLKTAVYIGLIINELVTNAYKHAFPTGKGKITINLKEVNKQYILEILDDGMGYDAKTSKHSLGLKLINVLVKHQLKGSLTTIVQPHCKYTIRFST